MHSSVATRHQHAEVPDGSDSKLNIRGVCRAHPVTRAGGIPQSGPFQSTALKLKDEIPRRACYSLGTLWLMVECCFTSTETVGLLGTGAQGGHLDFHTPPELCTL